MKKLGKNLNMVKESVEAYACSSSCGCDYNTSGGYYAYMGIYKLYKESFGR